MACLFAGSAAELARFIEILDRGFVDEHARFAAYFDRMTVIPLDHALDAPTVFQDEDHLRLLLYLLL